MHDDYTPPDWSALARLAETQPEVARRVEMAAALAGALHLCDTVISGDCARYPDHTGDVAARLADQILALLPDLGPFYPTLVKDEVVS